MAVRLDIRPRLRLAPDWQPGPVAPKRRLPPLAVPALAYWVAMAALTYGFTQLGPHPLEDAFAAPASAPAPVPVRAPEPEPQPPPPPEPTAAPAPVAEAAVSTEPSLAPPFSAAQLGSAVEPAGRPARRGAREEERARRDEPAPLVGTLPAEPARTLAFPELTDTAPRAPRERAADGPRIDSLFERAESSPTPAAPPTAPPAVAPPAAEAPTSLPSCEAAVARNEERLEIGGPRGPADITRESYATILQNGSYLRGCSVPERTVVEICAAVKQGRAVGVTVTSAPASAELTACVRRAVSRLRFPSSERLDVTHTRFDAARR